MSTALTEHNINAYHNTSSRHQGFAMMELLVVLTILIMLLAAVFLAGKFVGEKRCEKKHTEAVQSK